MELELPGSFLNPTVIEVTVGSDYRTVWTVRTWSDYRTVWTVRTVRTVKISMTVPGPPQESSHGA